METRASSDTIFQAGESLEIGLHQVEATLRHLWSAEQQGQRQVTRACVLNLVVMAGSEEQAETATAAVAELTATHPCRALVLITDEAAAESSLRAWLSAHCQLPKSSGQRVCCEQITLRAAAEAADTLPSAVLPLLVPDLPVALWWVDEPPFGAPVFEQLLGVADRLIVDTMRFDDPTFSLTRLAALIRANADRVAVSDLNWARLTPWQENLAQLFDSIDTLPYLERLERVSVRYARLPETGRVDPEQAFLLVGWLLSRLGWKIPPALPRVGSGHFRGRLRRAGRDLAIEVAPGTAALQAGRPDTSGLLLDVEVRAGFNDQTAIFRLHRGHVDEESITATIAMGENEPLTRTSILPWRNLASLMAEDLSRFDHDYLFEAALETAAHLSGAAQLLAR